MNFPNGHLVKNILINLHVFQRAFQHNEDNFGLMRCCQHHKSPPFGEWKQVLRSLHQGWAKRACPSKPWLPRKGTKKRLLTQQWLKHVFAVAWPNPALHTSLLDSAQCAQRIRQASDVSVYDRLGLLLSRRGTGRSSGGSPQVGANKSSLMLCAGECPSYFGPAGSTRAPERLTCAKTMRC